ncbi:MAG: prepilin-type N-terminal cleavage/methylation domain-containing protein [Sulfuricella sp.]|nr:prepilin-type N-terminal cleavage/methylation domain-containing protein [Sulfuricella sp.]
MVADRKNQYGFSLIEVVVAIVALTMLTTAFLSAFSSVLKSSPSPLQLILMEQIAAARLDSVMRLPVQSAIATAPVSTVTVEGTDYTITFTSSVFPNSAAPVSANIAATVTCNGCTSNTSLTGDIHAIW